MENDKRQFVAVWGAGYDARVETVSFDFFTEEAGYGWEDIERIQALQVGEAYQVDDMYTHTVVRVPPTPEPTPGVLGVGYMDGEQYT